MDYQYNITGVIKMLKPEGWGFIIPDSPVSPANKDVYFHASGLEDKSVEWADLRVGQKVVMKTIALNGRGYHAETVELIRPKSRARSARA